jgi:hypothetical protein
VVVVVGGRVVVVVVVVVVVGGVLTMSVKPELPPMSSKIVYEYDPGDAFDPAVNVHVKLGVEPPQPAEMFGWLETLTTDPSDATEILVDFPGRTCAEPGAESARAGATTKKRTTSSAAMKPVFPIREEAPRRARSVLPTCTVAPVACSWLRDYADAR